MATIDELVAAVGAALARGRAMVDAESRALLDLYSNDPFLRDVPVPHMRLDYVEVSLPVAVNVLEGSKGDVVVNTAELGRFEQDQLTHITMKWSEDDIPLGEARQQFAVPAANVDEQPAKKSK